MRYRPFAASTPVGLAGETLRRLQRPPALRLVLLLGRRGRGRIGHGAIVAKGRSYDCGMSDRPPGFGFPFGGDPEQFKDEYTEAVWELINAKIEHRAPTVVTGEAPSAKVINIMDALKKSVKAQGKQAAPSKDQQGKRTAASPSATKKTARAAPKRKSA